MTDTEKILNLLEINESIPCIVTEDDGIIISGNNIFIEKFKLFERGHNFYSLFDKNTALLIKNSFIDAKIFLKIQRRDVQINIDSKLIDLKLIISPFKLDSRIYFFILLYDDDSNEEIMLYPSLDENGITIKYKNIISSLKASVPKTLIDKKNLQYSLDIEKEAIAIKDRVQFLFTNRSFREGYSLHNNSKNIVTIDDILPEILSAKFKIAENEIYNTSSQFVLEKKQELNLAPQLFERVILYPVFNSQGLIESTLIVGKIKYESNTLTENSELITKKEKLNIDLGEEMVISNSEHAQLIYDKNNFDILDANLSASEMYGYEIEELKRMNITKLFVPEDMQKLIMPPKENGKFIFKHLTKSGQIIEVNVVRENIVWNDKEAYC
ncbi:MAG: PAS domain-containing protein, partial [Melioribacteraceae bacterium]|nr:PAS domain-containing protein [Melioribacteraceae bacterium]